MFFDIQPDNESLIKVIGVGGGGSNAVNFMHRQGISGVNFVICNTDQQALASSDIPTKIQLGPSLTGGRGAGAKPEVGKQATIESEEEIRKVLGVNTQMVFVTAGMGGGTGTGGAPVVAKIAKEMGILTVAIITVPFDFEGKSKKDKANSGLEELRANVDAIIIISNNKLRQIYGNLSLTAAFGHADNILTTAARGISEIITKPGLVNVDFEDVKTVMRESGVAIMGIGVASGENRATKAIDAALSSPLLDDADIYGARGILLYISSGTKEVTMDEVSQITDYVQQAASNDTEVIWGVCKDENLEDEVSVTLIATGFKTAEGGKPKKPEEKVVHTLGDNAAKSITITSDNKPTPAPTKSDDVTFTFSALAVEEPKPATIAQSPSIERQFQAPVEKADTHRELIRKKVSLDKLRDPATINDFEKEPAYMRKNVRFQNVPHSSQSHLSRYSLVDSFEDENGHMFDIKKNAFLDEKPD
jgi:cell division protein FtsZ